MLAAAVQAVTVVNTPLPVHITDVTDPILIKTYTATLIGIGIATIAAAAALWDLIRNTNQIRELARRPKFVVTYWAARQRMQRHGPNSDEPSINFNLDAQNIGERMTKDIKAEVLIPVAVMNEKVPDELKRTVPGRGDYRIYEGFPRNEYFFPFAVKKHVCGGQFFVNDKDQKFTALWRIYDEYGNYPQKDYGHLEFPHE